MLTKVLKFMGLNTHKAQLAEWKKACHRINAMEPKLLGESDLELQKRTFEHVAHCKVAGSRAGQQEMEISFALGREWSRRKLGMRHFDVQLVGAMALWEGKLAEMKTGEGKSLCLTLAAIHSAACGTQAHVVTVNEYLARRDAEAMLPLYSCFGFDVGLLSDGQSLEERRAQYSKDIVYGVNHEFGFDYLRHNMARGSHERRMLRGLGFAIIDEVDSILIDEARTPLIISGQEDDELSIYSSCWDAVQSMPKKLLEIDEKQRSVTLGEQAYERLESFFEKAGLIEHGHHLYEPSSHAILRALQACFSAKYLYHKDMHYIVDDGKVKIVDENTGRLMPDRRWANGIHQAVEAKEGVEIQQESKTLATITYQNFFKLYGKISGLTGTALTQAAEFMEIYGLECVPIPTHRPMVRKDQPDVIYRSEREKFHALALAAKEALSSGRPVLAGTSNIEESEKLSAELSRQGVPHQLLNAKNHELEAQIIEQAGFPGRMTVATNMAGRGTDIVLGGNWAAIESLLRQQGSSEEELASRRKSWEEQRQNVIDAGGLLVLGCARNDSRRVDNQLRGRSGRQGDPGESRFYISLDDALFRVYAQNGILSMIDKYNMMPEGSSLEHPMLNKSLDRAQASVENHHFNMRKQLLDFDGVGAAQRRVVYGWRDEVLEASSEKVLEMAFAFMEQSFEQALASSGLDFDYPESWMDAGALEALDQIAPRPAQLGEWLEADLDGSEIKKRFLGSWISTVKEGLSCAQAPAEALRSIILGQIDEAWQSHLTELQHLMDGIHLRSYAQKDPKQEYKREGYEMFGRLRDGIANGIAGTLVQWSGWMSQSFEEQALPSFSMGSQIQEPVADEAPETPKVDWMEEEPGGAWNLFEAKPTETTAS